MTVDRTLMPGGGSHRDAFLRNPPTHVEARRLTASAAEMHSVPLGAAIVAFSATGDFYARANAPAMVPSADVTDGSAAELNPTQWALDGVSSIGLIADTNTTVTMTYYTGSEQKSETPFPLTLPSLVEWFDSLDESTVGGADPAIEVESWTGRKGVYTVTNSVPAVNGPAYLDRSGRMALAYNSNGLRGDFAPIDPTTDYEIWTVFNGTSGSGRTHLQITHDVDPDPIIVVTYTHSNGAYRCDRRNDTGTLSRFDITPSGGDLSQPYVFRAYRDTSLFAEILGDNSAGPTTPPADPWSLNTTTFGSAAIGDLYAVLFFDVPLSDEIRASLSAFLGSRYGAFTG